MKHFRKILIATVLLLVFVSCGSNTEVLFSGDFEAKVHYMLSECEYTVLYNRSSECESIEVIEPKTLAGLLAKRKDGKVTLSFSDLEFLSVSDGMFAPFELFAECEAVRAENGIYKSESVTVHTNENMLPTEILGNIGGNEYKIEIIEFSKKGEPLK